jgi:uncharacterized protein
MTNSIFAVAVLMLVGGAALGSGSYETEVAEWRQTREENLKSDTGWLNVAGLFWLKQGQNTVGSAESNQIVMPAHSAPPLLGVLDHRADKTVLRYADRSKGTVELISDLNGKRDPTEIVVGDLTFWLIERGERIGIRMLDRQSQFRRDFTGCKWYPVRSEYLIEAKFVAEATQVAVPSVIGVTQDLPSPGYVEFELNGERVRLRPTGTLDKLFFVFRDGTSGRTTYGASRFLYSSVQENGMVLLDFNKAYNPPCTFTPYATCSLPTRENRIKVSIEAGELNYGDH